MKKAVGGGLEPPRGR